MPITSKWYPSAVAKMFNGDLNSADTFKIALLNSSGSFTSTHTLWSDVSANEISGTGYTTGGELITLSPATSDGTKASFPTGEVEWLAATITFSNAVIYAVESGALMLHLAYSAPRQ